MDNQKKENGKFSQLFIAPEDATNVKKLPGYVDCTNRFEFIGMIGSMMVIIDKCSFAGSWYIYQPIEKLEKLAKEVNHE